MDDVTEATTQPTAPETGGGETATPQAHAADGDGWLADLWEGHERPAPAVPVTDAPTTEAAPGPVPYERFQEVVHAQRALEEQYAPLQQWAAAIEHFTGLWVTPEQFAAKVAELQSGTQPVVSASPEDQFSEWLAAQEIDPDECTRAELLSLQSTFRHDQILNQYQAQAQAQVEQAQQEALQARWVSDLQQLSTDYPEFANPVLRDALLNTYEGRYGIQPNAQQLGALALELRGAIELQTQAAIAKYAQGKSQDAAVPVTAGGNSPAPVEVKNFHEMSEEEQMAAFRAHRQAAAYSG